MMNQKGFTLIELLVGLAITGLLLPVMANSVHQITFDTARNTNKITALVQVEGGARVLGKDIRSAQTTDLVSGADPVSSMSLDWTDWTDVSSFDAYADANLVYPGKRAVWSLVGTDLQRIEGTCSDYNLELNQCSVAWVDDPPRTIARYLTSAEFSMDAAGQGEIITVKYTASPDPVLGKVQAETYTLEAFPRFLGAPVPVQ